MDWNRENLKPLALSLPEMALVKTFKVFPLTSLPMYRVWFTMFHMAKCYTKLRNCYSNPKVCSRFYCSKALNLPCVALQNTTQTLMGITTQIQKCLAVFATKKRTKIEHWLLMCLRLALWKVENFPRLLVSGKAKSLPNVTCISLPAFELRKKDVTSLFLLLWYIYVMQSAFYSHFLRIRWCDWN